MNRRGFTTVELMVALVLLGVISGGIATLLRRQRRFFTNAASLVEQRISLRDATGILPGELRALSPAGGDVIAFSDSALEIHATIGAAILCDTLPTGDALALAPARESGAVISSFTTAPQAGDVAVVYDGGTPGPRDDRWIPLGIASTASSTAVCATSPFVSAADASLPRTVLRLASGTRVAPTVLPGAFVRVLRRVRYRFYRSGAGEWYLGYAEWDGSAYGVVQPVSGPFAPYSRRGASGVWLRYFDRDGAELFAASDAPRIARIDVAVRGVQRGDLAGRGLALTDSQSIGVGVRNQ